LKEAPARVELADLDRGAADVDAEQVFHHGFLFPGFSQHWSVSDTIISRFGARARAHQDEQKAVADAAAFASFSGEKEFRLLLFAVNRLLLAMRAILLHFHPVGMEFLVLIGEIVLLLAFRADQDHLRSSTSGSHVQPSNQSLIYFIIFWVKKQAKSVSEQMSTTVPPQDSDKDIAKILDHAKSEVMRTKKVSEFRLRANCRIVIASASGHQDSIYWEPSLNVNISVTFLHYLCKKSPS